MNPHAYSTLACRLVRAARRIHGPRGVRRLREVMVRTLQESCAARLPSTRLPLGERIEVLAAVLRDQGLDVRMQRAGDGEPMLVETHCPLADARLCQPGFCDILRQVLQGLLGPAITVECRDRRRLATHERIYRFGAPPQ